MTTAPTTSVPTVDESATPPPAEFSAPVYLRRVDSPIGRIEMTADEQAITSLAIERDGHLPHDQLTESSNAVLESAATQLAEYFAGERHDFDLPVNLAGTEFQRAVWAELARLKFGAVSSYGAIGLATGRPTAGRAVGGAIGANPVPIIIGCHRVLAANHKITGYSGGSGIPTKVWLLDHESIAHA
ncbi:MAG: methylated-DNA--[protein]-cysteine S-methyltransferase [Microbacteriaceae bacterium]|nr:methylated-DNA--[protein]-cysteine S-methyltransferase [Microbacteriaceae bacterium]